MNIEHRTPNVQHRIMNSVNLKKTEQSESTLRNSIWLLSTGSSPELAEGNSSQATVFRSRLQRDSLVLR